MALISRNFGFIANDIAYPPSPPPPTLPTIQAISTNKIMGLLLECECRVFLGLIIFVLLLLLMMILVGGLCHHSASLIPHPKVSFVN
jgi:hypothetical protein